MINSEISDTIAAISTPQAQGGIAVIRVSGTNAFQVAEKIFRPINRKITEMKGYTACFGEIFSDETKLDEGILTVFFAPHSYTGENVAEISCHGGIYVSRQVLHAAVNAGARLAEPGEFTKRAFLNNKLSLTQAEAVAEIIYARNKQFLAGANSLKEGVLHNKLNGISEALLDISAKISVCLDYPDEEPPDLNIEEIKTVMETCLTEIRRLAESYDTGRILRDGVLTAITGKPNAGKSSLMNLISETKRSIVSDIAGTTRDIVEESVNLDGVILRLSDCAGLRKSSRDPIEQTGIENMLGRIKSSEFIIAVFDVSNPLDDNDYALIEKIGDIPSFCVMNKIDLGINSETERILQEKFVNTAEISAKNINFLQPIKGKILSALNMNGINSSFVFLACERQFLCAKKAAAALEKAVFAVTEDISACGVMLSETLDALFALSGKNADETIINEVFRKFCVGK